LTWFARRYLNSWRLDSDKYSVGDWILSTFVILPGSLAGEFSDLLPATRPHDVKHSLGSDRNGFSLNRCWWKWWIIHPRSKSTQEIRLKLIRTLDSMLVSEQIPVPQNRPINHSNNSTNCLVMNAPRINGMRASNVVKDERGPQREKWSGDREHRRFGTPDQILPTI
jgi:hypothetical protein